MDSNITSCNIAVQSETQDLSCPSSDFEVLSRSDLSPSYDALEGSRKSPWTNSEACHADSAMHVSDRPDPSAQMMSSLLSGSSIEFDLDVNTLQTKIRSVLVENLKLRDSIRQSSATLRQQCEVLLTWQHDNQRLRQQRRQVVQHSQRARDIILQLRRENAELRQQQQTEGRQSAADVELELRSQLSRADRQLRDARLEVERLQSKLARQQTELTVCRQSNTLVSDWHATDDQLGRQLDAQRQQLEAGRQQLDVKRQQLNSERQQLALERQQLAQTYAGQSGDQQHAHDVLETVRRSGEQVQAELVALHDYQRRLDVVSGALDGLQAQLDCGEADPALRAELVAVRAALALDAVQARQDATDAIGATSAWHHLQQLLDSVVRDWQLQPPTARDHQRHQVDMDGLQARILSMEELLEARGTECERLQRQVLQLRRDLQAVDILKAQVDVYQQDFNQERRQREQLVSEREQLRREVSQLQAHCRQLEVQRTSPPSNGSVNQPSPSPQLHQLSSTQPQVERQPTVYTCPKCDMAFLDVVALQNHANRCLDEE